MNDETKDLQLQTRALPGKGRALFGDFAVEEFLEFLIQLPDPDVVLRAAGLSRADLRKLEGDDEISSCMESRLSAVMACPWRLEPGEGELVKFVWAQIERHYEPLITGAWNAVPYGYAVQEVIYRPEDGRVVIERVSEKPMEWFEPRRDGTLRYYPASNLAPAAGIPVDTEFKFLLTRRRPTYRNPYGQAILSRLYWPWFFRTKGWRFWGRFLERFGSPFLLGKTIGSQEDLDSFAAQLEKAVQSAVAVVGLDDEVNAIEPGNGGDSFERFERAINARIQKVLLGRAITSDLQKVGSNAAQKTDDRVREDRRDADVRMLTHTVQTLINALTRLNFQGSEPPTFVMEGAQGLEVERSERDLNLSKAGVRFTKDYLLRAYDFEPEDVEIAPQAVEPVGLSLPGGRFSAFLADLQAQRFTPEQQSVERLLGSVTEGNPQPIDPQAVLGAIRASENPDDLTARLVELAADNTTAVQFRELLERALFAADVMGYAHADNE